MNSMIVMLTRSYSIFQNRSVVTLVGLVAIIIIWLITREIMNWYWKINARVKLQEEMNVTLRSILSELQKMNNHGGPNQN